MNLLYNVFLPFSFKKPVIVSQKFKKISMDLLIDRHGPEEKGRLSFLIEVSAVSLPQQET